jgi:hypothetical protein
MALMVTDAEASNPRLSALSAEMQLLSVLRALL